MQRTDDAIKIIFTEIIIFLITKHIQEFLCADINYINAYKYIRNQFLIDTRKRTTNLGKDFRLKMDGFGKHFSASLSQTRRNVTGSSGSAALCAYPPAVKTGSA